MHKNKKSSYISLLSCIVPLLVLVLLQLIGCVQSTAFKKSPDDFKPQPTLYKPPSPEEWKLQNGLKILYLKDDELPLVRGTLYLKGGTLWEKEDEKGFLSAVGAELRDGGAGSLKPKELDRILESLAAAISSDYGDEYGAVSFHCLKEDLEKVFKIFSDVVLNPRFDQRRLELWKKRSIESIRRRAEDPNTIANIAFRQLVYGDSPYGKVLDIEDIQRIERIDLLRTHRKFVRPNGAILAISGDVDANEINALTKQYLSNWNAREESLEDLPDVEQFAAPGIYFIEFPFTQSTVEIGHIGVKRFTPDFMAINGFNYIFGSSGFSSRLMQEIRTKNGLAYDVYGAINPGVVKGVNVIYLQTAAETTGTAINKSIGVLLDLKHNLVSDKDLNVMKRAITNSFIFKFESPQRIVRRRALLKILDYPSDFDETFLEKLSLVSAYDIKNVAENRWNLQQFIIVVVGNKVAKDSLLAERAKAGSLLSQFPFRVVKFDHKLRL